MAIVAPLVTLLRLYVVILKLLGFNRRLLVLELLIVVLLVIWLLGYFGPARFPSIPRTGNFVHLLLVIVIILVILRLLR